MHVLLRMRNLSMFLSEMLDVYSLTSWSNCSKNSGDAHHVVNPVASSSQLNNMWSMRQNGTLLQPWGVREYFQTTALKYIFVCIYLLTYMYYLRMIMKGTQDDDDGSNRHHFPLFPLFQTFHSTWNAQGHMPAVLPATGGSPAVNVHFTPFMHSLAFFARRTAYQRIIQGVCLIY